MYLWDQAVKLELVYGSAWQSRAEARADVFEYLEVFYNGNGFTRR